MKIGYRRWSTPIGLSDKETCKISGWLEKRKALLKFLEERGHEVLLMSRATPPSKGMWDHKANLEKINDIDCLFIEMSNHNLLHNYKDVAESVRILNEVTCPVYVLWDDPELEFHIWSNKMNDLWIKKDKITVFANCENIEGNEDYLEGLIYYKQHIEVKETKFEFFPIVSLLNYEDHSFSKAEQIKMKVVYLGGPSGGRKAEILKLRQHIPIEVYYNTKSWPIPIDGEAPLQVERLNFYSSFIANIGLQDHKHKKLGWLTGRCFHALMAGTPSLVPEDSNLAKYFTTYNHENIQDKLEDCMTDRDELVERQKAKISGLKWKLIDTLEKYGI